VNQEINLQVALVVILQIVDFVKILMVYVVPAIVDLDLMEHNARLVQIPIVQLAMIVTAHVLAAIMDLD